MGSVAFVALFDISAHPQLYRAIADGEYMRQLVAFISRYLCLVDVDIDIDDCLGCVGKRKNLA